MVCSSDKVEKLISGGSGLIFKGSGFYLTDYKKGKKSIDDNSKSNQKKNENSKQSEKTETKNTSSEDTATQKKEKKNPKNAEKKEKSVKTKQDPSEKKIEIIIHIMYQGVYKK